MKRTLTLFVLAALTLSTGACACRGGYVGRYGGVHPGHCWVW